MDDCSAFKVLLGVGDLVWASTGELFSNSVMLLLKAGQLLWNRGLLFWIESLLRSKRLVWLSTKENSTLIMLCQLTLLVWSWKQLHDGDVRNLNIGNGYLSSGHQIG